MYNGWLSLAGTEIANAARTEAYVRGSASTTIFDPGMPTEGMANLLGEADYRTPALDPAPWFSESRPESQKFLGMLPLEIIGVEDSTRSVVVTQLNDDGGAFSRPRRATKEFRVRGLLLGLDEEGLDAGARWLGGVLEGSGCGDSDCLGDTFCYLGYKPDFCDYNNENLYPEYVEDWAYTGTPNEKIAPYGAGILGTDPQGMKFTMPCGGDGIQYIADGMVPGEYYRLSLNMRSSGPLVVSINGNELYRGNYKDLLSPTRGVGPWLIDFKAPATSALIRITSGVDDCTPTTGVLNSLILERTGEFMMKTQPRFSYDNFTEPSTWSFSMLTSDPDITTSAELAGVTETEEIEFAFHNPSGSDAAIVAGSGVRRILRGLEPGRSYTVVMRYTSTADFDFAPFIIGQDAPTTYYRGNGWVSIHFTATATQHYLALQLVTTETIISGGTVTLNLDFLGAQTNFTYKYLPEVDQLAPARRHLYGVTLISGPSTVETFPSERGLAKRIIEFSMVVTRPSAYSDLREVNISPESTTYLVSSEECRNGEPVRVNLFTNPFFRNGATSGGMAVYLPFTGSYNALSVEFLAYSGWNYLKVASHASTNNSYVDIAVNSSNGFIDGHTYTVSATFYQAAAQTGTLHALARSIAVIQDVGTIVSEPALNTPGYQRVSVSFVKSQDVSSIRLYSGSQGATQFAYWGGILIEESGIAGDPFDGESRTGASWEGTVRQSTSRWAKPDSVTITDPDCAPLPVAPQPPSLVPDCPRTTTEWRRYWLEVPAELSGGWSESTPVIRLTTSENEVRDVRIRLYPNPARRGIDEVEPCAYCGEFYISYIPSSTVMTIDGVNQVALADVRGLGAERAMHLISDYDYGPIQWPALSCDMPYFMTVDIAPNEVLDLDVQLDIAMKE